MYIPDDSLTRDDALEQAAVCMRLARAIGSGNEHLIPGAQRLLHRIGRPGPIGGLVDSAVGPDMDSELPPRASQPVVRAPADDARPDAPTERADEPVRPAPATNPPSRRRRRTGSIL